MWIKGLGGICFGAFGSEAGQTLFGFDSEEGGLKEVRTATGSTFTPYSIVTEVFGEIMVSGRPHGVEGDAVGYELYHFNDDGALSLFSEITHGSASYFFDLDTIVPGFEDDGRILALEGGGDRVPTFLFTDGSTSRLSDEIPGVEEITGFKQAYPHDDGFIFSYKSNPGFLQSFHSYHYDFRTDSATFLNSFDIPMHPTYISAWNQWTANGRVFADIRGWTPDSSESVSGLWELVDGVWTYLTMSDSENSIFGARPAMVFDGEVYVGGHGQAGNNLY
ncbi:hypothetical protein [Roseobacter sp. OBYS 0001]|uniref:hypothetical protein n=1 Tax=Roseobacter sp. OBYS 0001 TaxID=882651 RepID=UPI001BB9A929|nr:hypothetical protein [Roseobacter sp. OBYS 0001]GIT88157.1 hypothetical protein ROBYS_31730 [Roseobacter sp. OBYS 0001]